MASADQSQPFDDVSTAQGCLSAIAVAVVIINTVGSPIAKRMLRIIQRLYFVGARFAQPPKSLQPECWESVSVAQLLRVRKNVRHGDA